MPFAVTVDYETVEKQTVTIRERDTTKQVSLAPNVTPAAMPKSSAFLHGTASMTCRYLVKPSKI